MADNLNIEHPLLQPTDPDPVGILRRDTQSPFVLVCDHAGNAVPQQLDRLGLPDDELERHIGIDIGAVGVAKYLSALLDAPLVYQRYSRLVIDCNRRPDDVASRPEVSDGTSVPGNRDLPDAQARQRMAEIFRPYHDAITALLDLRASKNRATVLIAVHSFTPELRSSETERPWHTDIMFDRDARVGKALLNGLANEPDILAGENEPYGINTHNDYTIPEHGEGRQLPYAGIEIRQDLLLTSEHQQAWAARLARLLPRAIADAGIA